MARPTPKKTPPPAQLVKIISRAANAILADEPGPIIRHRILRDTPELDASASTLRRLRRQLDDDTAVKRLRTLQHHDGGWGGLHCGRPTATREIARTEDGVARALALGLDARHPCLLRTCSYLADLLRGRRVFPELERNERAIPGWRMFAAATLAQIQPHHPALDGPFDTWRRILTHTFADGTFSATREAEIHRELHGIAGEIRYLHLRNKYAVTLIGSRVEELPRKIEQAYVRWLWSVGLGYLDVPIARPPARGSASRMDRWFTSHEILSAYPSWRSHCEKTVDWLCDQQHDRGLWDFGPREAQSPHFHLSSDKPIRIAREHEWSLRVLRLMR
jgi:hypothetical protein